MKEYMKNKWEVSNRLSVNENENKYIIIKNLEKRRSIKKGSNLCLNDLQ